MLNMESLEGKGMLIIFIVGCTIGYVVLQRKRNIESQGKSKRIAYFFCDNSIRFLIPLVLVMSFYFTLFVVFSVSSQILSLESLIQLEESLPRIRSSFSFLKLDAKEVLVVLLFLYLLGLFGLSAQKSKRLFGLFDKYRKLTRQIYIVLVLLCSFTFFGTQVGDPTKDLRLRIKTIREGYADVREELYEDLSKEVANELYDKVVRSFPSSYQRALELPLEIEQHIVRLDEQYVSYQSQYGLESLSVSLVLQDGQSRIEAASNLRTEIEITSEANEHLPAGEPDPRTTTYQKIIGVRKAIENYRKRTVSRGITFLQIEGGRKLTCHIPRLLTSEIKGAIFEEWTEAYPVLGPVVDVVFRTIDKELETRMGEAVDQIVDSAMQGDTLEELISEEASRIVRQQNIEIAQTILQEADIQARKLENEVLRIEQAVSELETLTAKAEDGRIESLIAQLSSAGDMVSIEASRELSAMGEKLSEEHVTEIIRVMRTGDMEWRKQLRREGHCTWYEITTDRYRAADCLNNMNSSYVSDEIRKEARGVIARGKTEKKVTDPGWI